MKTTDQNAHIRTTYEFLQAQLDAYNRFDPSLMDEYTLMGWNLLRGRAQKMIRAIWAHGMGA